EKMKKMDAEGRIHYPSKKTGRLALKRYLNEMKGSPLENIWDDIGMLQHASKEKTGWSTQKPLALIERIIQLGSNEGDLIFDCFAGSGTTLEAAHNLKRKWFGIEQSPSAVCSAYNLFLRCCVKIRPVPAREMEKLLGHTRPATSKATTAFTAPPAPAAVP
ncbi:MAG: site-specific DNA-methyltransferase, partial [Oxalobacteraceae bacterium]